MELIKEFKEERDANLDVQVADNPISKQEGFTRVLLCSRDNI